METNTDVSTINFFDRQVKSLEKNRFGAMAIMMTAQSCLGSIAAMYSLKVENIMLLVICATITMISNSSFITLSPAKWCLILFYMSIAINLFIIIITIF